MNETPKQITGMRRLSFYTASPVETCDRCSQGIKHVALVTMKDGTSQKYGMDCINKILEGDTSLKSLFAKNAKLLKKYEAWLAILSRPFAEIPHTAEYYNSGIFIITDAEDKMISVSQGSILFHPTVDLEKNAGSRYPANGKVQSIPGKGWVAYTPELREQIALEKLEAGKVWLTAEIERIGAFLARMLNNAATNAAVK